MATMVRPTQITTEAEYDAAVHRIEHLSSSPLGSEEAEEVDGWMREIEAYARISDASERRVIRIGGTPTAANDRWADEPRR